MISLAEAMARCPLVAILRGIRPDEAEAIGDILVAAGFTILEVPLNSPQPLDSIRRLSRRFGGRALVGAGTVIDPAQVAEIAEAGGRLIVMPHGDVDIVRAAKQADLAAMPGFATPTEAFACLSAGADALKMFPAETLPPAALKAMRAVLPPEVPILPVGGITPERMAGYWDAGAAGFGLGSALYKPDAEHEEVGNLAQRFITALHKLARR
jgi:2-dehydro-3-deoxyphosphogalactonate aldolase